jgi:hypothetical protein
MSKFIEVRPGWWAFYVYDERRGDGEKWACVVEGAANDIEEAKTLARNALVRMVGSAAVEVS